MTPDFSEFESYRFTAHEQNVFMSEGDWGIRWLSTKYYSDAAFIAEACGTYFEHLSEIARLRAAVDDLTAENTALRQMLDGFMQAQDGGEE